MTELSQQIKIIIIRDFGRNNWLLAFAREKKFSPGIFVALAEVDYCVLR
jgi:hypothetical protein